MNPYDFVTPDYKLKINRDLEELQTDLAKATSKWGPKVSLKEDLTKTCE